MAKLTCAAGRLGSEAKRDSERDTERIDKQKVVSCILCCTGGWRAKSGANKQKDKKGTCAAGETTIYSLWSF